MVGGTNLPPTMQTAVKFRNFAEVYLRSLKTYPFQTEQFDIIGFTSPCSKQMKNGVRYATTKLLGIVWRDRLKANKHGVPTIAVFQEAKIGSVHTWCPGTVPEYGTRLALM